MLSVIQDALELAVMRKNMKAYIENRIANGYEVSEILLRYYRSIS